MKLNQIEKINMLTDEQFEKVYINFIKMKRFENEYRKI